MDQSLNSKNRYHRGNPKYKEGMVFTHKKNPNYIIQLIGKGQYGRWLCAVLSGEPAKGAGGVLRYDVPKEVTPGLKKWLGKDGQMIVQYSTCAFSTCFVQSEMAEVLYMDSED